MSGPEIYICECGFNWYEGDDGKHDCPHGKDIVILDKNRAKLLVNELNHFIDKSNFPGVVSMPLCKVQEIVDIFKHVIK